MTGSCDIETAIENSEPLAEMGQKMVKASVRRVASDTGRSVESQWERMGDHFAYAAVEQDPAQKQLDDYEISGDTVEVTV